MRIWHQIEHIPLWPTTAREPELRDVRDVIALLRLNYVRVTS
jgi:hypothetical protein